MNYEHGDTMRGDRWVFRRMVQVPDRNTWVPEGAIVAEVSAAVFGEPYASSTRGKVSKFSRMLERRLGATAEVGAYLAGEDTFRNPTLVHHGRASAAAFHVVSDDFTRGPVADLYHVNLAQATAMAQKLADVLGLRLRLLDNSDRPRNLEAHHVPFMTQERARRRRNPEGAPVKGELWGKRGGGTSRVLEATASRVHVVDMGTGNRAWLERTQFLATHNAPRRRNPSRSKVAGHTRAARRYLSRALGRRQWKAEVRTGRRSARTLYYEADRERRTEPDRKRSNPKMPKAAQSPMMQRAFKAAFPNYKGRKYRYDIRPTIHVNNTWGGGSRQDTVFVRLDNFAVLEVPDTFRTGPHTVDIPPGAVAVTHEFFQGVDTGLSMTIPPGSPFPLSNLERSNPRSSAPAVGSKWATRSYPRHVVRVARVEGRGPEATVHLEVTSASGTQVYGHTRQIMGTFHQVYEPLGATNPRGRKAGFFRVWDDSGRVIWAGVANSVKNALEIARAEVVWTPLGPPKPWAATRDDELSGPAVGQRAKPNPRVHVRQGMFRVTFSRAEVEAFKSRWPNSGLPSKAISFDFYPTGQYGGDTLTPAEAERTEGTGSVVALSDDAVQALRRSRLTRKNPGDYRDPRTDSRGFGTPKLGTLAIGKKRFAVYAGNTKSAPYYLEGARGAAYVVMRYLNKPWLFYVASATGHPPKWAQHLTLTGETFEQLGVFTGANLKMNPGRSSNERARAEKMFRTWHEFDSKTVKRVRVPSRTIPRHVVKLGEVVRIDYKSNKWEGKPVTYTHSTKRPYPELVTDPDGRQLYLVGGRMKPTADGLVN